MRLEVRTLVRALKLNLGEGDSLVESLNALIHQKWTTQVLNGQTVISAAEAGGSVTFTFQGAYTPAQLAIMAEQALEYINTGAEDEDKEDPDVDVACYGRIHTTFHKAVL